MDEAPKRTHLVESGWDQRVIGSVGFCLPIYIPLICTWKTYVLRIFLISLDCWFSRGFKLMESNSNGFQGRSNNP